MHVTVCKYPLIKYISENILIQILIYKRYPNIVKILVYIYHHRQREAVQGKRKISGLSHERPLKGCDKNGLVMRDFSTEATKLRLRMYILTLSHLDINIKMRKHNFLQPVYLSLPHTIRITSQYTHELLHAPLNTLSPHKHNTLYKAHLSLEYHYNNTFKIDSYFHKYYCLLENLFWKLFKTIFFL